jgi:hypothetical protein
LHQYKQIQTNIVGGIAFFISLCRGVGAGMDSPFKDRNQTRSEMWDFFAKKSHIYLTWTFLRAPVEFFDEIFLKSHLLIEIYRLRMFLWCSDPDISSYRPPKHKSILKNRSFWGNRTGNPVSPAQ